MNKKLAKEKSIAGEISVGELRKMIATARPRGGMSRVNPQFTLEQTCDIFEKALTGRDDTEIPSGMRLDTYRQQMVPSRDSLIIRNILRDCAS
jgi:hypothetical protein